MAVQRWDEWAEAVMGMMVEVKPGENLLIMADTRTNMEIANACLVAGINAKANAQLLVVPSRLETDKREPNPVTAGAIMGADVIVGIDTGFDRSVAMREAAKKGTRFTMCAPREEGEDWVIEGTLDVDFPRMIEIGEKICDLWQKTETCRVTSELGTDISFRLKGRPCDAGYGWAIDPGVVDGHFPGGTPSIAPIEETINGTIVVDGLITGCGQVSEPVTARLEKGVITSIEGGKDANSWRSLLESTGEPKAFHLCHFNVGINPRAEAPSDKAVGIVNFGFGHQDALYEGTVGQDVKMHTDITLRWATIYVDGVVMCENEQLYPDLGPAEH
jgi:2,5-dihydroxypyridine 5,6-dioxygenase